MVVTAPAPRTASGRSRFELLGVIGLLSGWALTATMLRDHPAAAVAAGPVSVALFVVVNVVTRLTLGEQRLVFLHHFVAIVAAGTPVLAALDVPALAAADALAAGLFTFLAFGRVGCWTAGCCHGRRCRRGTVYPPEADVPVPLELRGVPLAPTQLIDAVLATGSAVLAATTGPRGAGVAAGVVAYCAGRSVLETWRGDSGRARIWGVPHTFFTIAGLLVLVLGVPAPPTIRLAALPALAVASLAAIRATRQPAAVMLDGCASASPTTTAGPSR